MIPKKSGRYFVSYKRQKETVEIVEKDGYQYFVGDTAPAQYLLDNYIDKLKWVVLK